MSATMDGVKPIHVVHQGGVAWLTLAAPQAGNVLNATMVGALHRAIDQAIDNADCRVIVIQAQGADFCKGLDLDWAAQGEDGLAPDFPQQVLACLTALAEADKPVIAVVEGVVSGGGVGLVAACDMVLAGPHATFMLPEVIIGMIPALISPFLLRRLSLARLRYLTLSSRELTATEAKAFGLVDEVATETSVANLLTTQLQRLFRSSPAAIAASKHYFLQLEGRAFADQVALAQSELESWLAQPDVLAALQDFSEGFSPTWWAKYRPKENETNDQ